MMCKRSVGNAKKFVFLNTEFQEQFNLSIKNLKCQISFKYFVPVPRENFPVQNVHQQQFDDILVVLVLNLE